MRPRGPCRERGVEVEIEPRIEDEVVSSDARHVDLAGGVVRRQRAAERGPRARHGAALRRAIERIYGRTPTTGPCSSFLPFIAVDARLDGVRSDPRFNELVRRMNFPAVPTVGP